MKTTEKKVEYIELIYDLIFVYVIGRNNALLENTENGFVTWQTLLAYLLCTLAVIQIWNFSTYYINMYGRNSARDHISLFFNMFMLYSMGVGTRADWFNYQFRYHIAWGLILVNIAVQYLIEYRERSDDPKHAESIRKIAAMLLIEAAIIFAAAMNDVTPAIILSAAAILFGIIITHITGGSSYMNVDFTHLSERAMLYIVFTFGEMIVAITDYFDDDESFGSIYFAVMAFLIVVGLFLSYEVFYDRIVDRELQTNGLKYMFLHVWMIFGLNNISSALAFMHEEEVDLAPKLTFLTVSFIIYYGSMYGTRDFAKKACSRYRNFGVPLIMTAFSYAALMLVFRNNAYINIALTVIYVFGLFLMLYRYAKRIERSEHCCLEL